jgi:hypothetical protein
MVKWRHGEGDFVRGLGGETEEEFRGRWKVCYCRLRDGGWLREVKPADGE